MPVPVPDAVTAPFWEGCAVRELRIQRCARCGTHRHVPSPLCHRCQSFEVSWDISAGDGRVFSYIVVHRSAHPATDERVPYNVAVVQLDDCGGVLVTSNVVDGADDDLHVGLPVRLVWEPVHPTLSLYRFAPVRSARGR
jgi:uncharacterized OB-fold protein